MTRHAIVVQLTDGDLGAAQAEAIRAECMPGESVSAMCRRVLLGYIGRSELDSRLEKNRARPRK